MLRPVRFVSTSTSEVAPHRDRHAARGEQADDAPDHRRQPQRDRQLDRVDQEPEPIGAGILVIKPCVVVQVPRARSRGDWPRSSAHPQSKSVRKPSADRQRSSTARDRHDDRAIARQRRARRSAPTGRNARVKNMPNAITIPDSDRQPDRRRPWADRPCVQPRGPGGQGQGRRREQGVGRVGDRLEQVGGRSQRPERRRRPGRRRGQRHPREQIKRHDGAAHRQGASAGPSHTGPRGRPATAVADRLLRKPGTPSSTVAGM